MNYHIGRLFLSSLCVGAFIVADIWWCSFCRLKPAKRTPPNISHNKSSNTQRTEKKTTDVVIHQHSLRLLKMDILISETCWAHNKRNKTASDIKLVFYSTIAMMHGPINIRSMLQFSIPLEFSIVHCSKSTRNPLGLAQAWLDSTRSVWTSRDSRVGLDWIGLDSTRLCRCVRTLGSQSVNETVTDTVTNWPLCASVSAAVGQSVRENVGQCTSSRSGVSVVKYLQCKPVISDIWHTSTGLKSFHETSSRQENNALCYYMRERDGIAKQTVNQQVWRKAVWFRAIRYQFLVWDAKYCSSEIPAINSDNFIKH